jgi:ATP-dependent Clp protease ATP-binding subunit ClpA
MFERFTHAAREVVTGAQTEAKDLDHPWIGTEHVLLALVADETGAVAVALRGSGVDEVYVRDEIIRRVVSSDVGPAAGPDPDTEAEDAAALKAIGIDLAQVRRAIEENFGPGSLQLPAGAAPRRKGLFRRIYGEGRTPFSPRAKKVLELSLREALRLKQDFIAPEHIMLGLLREGHGLAAQILAEKDVDVDRLRADLERSLTDKAA